MLLIIIIIIGTDKYKVTNFTFPIDKMQILRNYVNRVMSISSDIIIHLKEFVNV